MNGDRIKCAVASAPGTGTVSIGSAAAGFQSFQSAFAGNGSVEYLLLEGNAWETGVGLFNRSANTLTRGLSDSSTKALVNFGAAAIVICTAIAATHIADWPILSVSRIASSTGFDQSFQTIGRGFELIRLGTTAAVDTHGGWNLGNDEMWTVPAGQAGVYDIQGKIRPNDGTPEKVNFCVAVDVANQDSADSAWWTTVADYKAPSPTQDQAGPQGRYFGYNSRIMMLTAGQKVRLCGFGDYNSGVKILSAALYVTRIR